MRAFSRGAGAAIAALALLAVAALAGQAILSGPEPRASPTRTTATPAFPSAEPSFDLQLPLTTTEVAPGRRVMIEGTGPRQIAYRVADADPVVVALDCRLCQGPLTYLSGSAPRPFHAGPAPWSGEHLLNLDVADRRTLLRVDALGHWVITLTSLSALAPTRPPVTGTGARVLVLDAPGSGIVVTGQDPATPVTVTARPLGAAATPPAGPATGSGVTLLVALPAVVTVESDGPWALEVRP